MTTPPATCPACGSGLKPSGSDNGAFYECGAYCCTVDFGNPNEWIFTKNFVCRNAFDIAVKQRAEIERIKAQLALCEEALAFCELDAQPEELKE